MSKESRISARVDESVKEEANRIFETLGLSTSSAISIFLNQVVREQGFPFRPHLTPNSTTQTSMDRTRSGDVETFDDEEALFDELGL